MHNVAFVALTKIPWSKVGKTSLLLLEAARKIYDTIARHANSSKSKKKDAKISITVLNNRIKTLENNEVEQAKLISQIAGQIEVLSNSLRVVGARFNLTLFISICATILVLFTIIWIVLF